MLPPDFDMTPVVVTGALAASSGLAMGLVGRQLLFAVVTNLLPRLVKIRSKSKSPEPVIITEPNVVRVERTVDLSVGRERWAVLIRSWVVNLGVEGAPQVDRAGLLVAAFSGLQGASCTAYIRSRGGLAGATLDALLSLGFEADKAPMQAKLIALNMVQIGSASGVPTDRLIERSLLCRPEDLESVTIGGGPLDSTVDIGAGRRNPFTQEDIIT